MQHASVREHVLPDWIQRHRVIASPVHYIRSCSHHQVRFRGLDRVVLIVSGTWRLCYCLCQMLIILWMA